MGGADGDILGGGARRKLPLTSGSHYIPQKLPLAPGSCTVASQGYIYSITSGAPAPLLLAVQTADISFVPRLGQTALDLIDLDTHEYLTYILHTHPSPILIQPRYLHNQLHNYPQHCGKSIEFILGRAANQTSHNPVPFHPILSVPSVQ